MITSEASHAEAYTCQNPCCFGANGPRCPKSQGGMMLARIQPGTNGSHRADVGCPKCEHVQKMLIEDPLKSANMGWTVGGLKPQNEERRHGAFEVGMDRRRQRAP
jgi:hypothetical protein